MPSAVFAILLFILTSLGCNQTYTAAWAPMGEVIKKTVRPADFIPERRIFLEVVAKLAPGRKAYDNACSDFSDTGAYATDECKDWLDERALEMDQVLVILLEQRQTTSEVVLTNRTPDWKTRIRDGDLKVRIIVKDTFQRDFTWAFFVAWRSDTYRLDATVEVSDARTGRHLRTFDRSHRHRCGLNYLWLIDVFIPLIPFYITDNQADRSEGAESLAIRLADDISDASNQARDIPPPARDPGIPAPRAPPADALRTADLSCIESRIFINNAELKGFPTGSFDGTPREDLAEVFASGAQSAFFEAGVREVFTLVNLEQQLQ